MVTYIRNIENYTPLEIIVVDNSLFTFEQGIRFNPGVLRRDYRKKTLIMNEYYTVETSQISVFTNVPPQGRAGIYNSLVGKRFNFYKNGTLLYRFEIVTDSLIRVSANDRSIGTFRKFIRVINDDYTIKNEIEPNAPNALIYFDVTDEKIGNLVIKQYRSRSANQSPNSRWDYQTGFIIEVNGEEYGVLAFFPKPRLYKNNNFMEINDVRKESRIILYIFMAYKRLNQNDDVFVRR